MKERQTVLITGGTGGIGFQTAVQLATRGMQIIVTGRDAIAGATAVATIQQLSNNHAVSLITGDLATRAGVERIIAGVTAQTNQLDVLIHNAGAVTETRQLNDEGMEKMYAVNVWAPWVLTQALQPLLASRPAARVIALTGGEHPKTIDLDRQNGEGVFVGLDVYSHAKLMMMAVMYEYALRLRDTSITVNVCYPGQASTRMTQQVTPVMVPRVLQILWPLFRLAVRDDDGRSARKASQSSVFLATAATLAGHTGEYYDRRCRLVAWPQAVLDTRKRLELWNRLEHR